MLSPSFVFAFVVGVVTELAREGVLSELLCADDLVLIGGTIEELKDKSSKWKEAFGSKENQGDGQRQHCN